MSPKRSTSQCEHGAIVVLLSGGLDSAFCAAWARRRYACVHAITIDYGQRARKEIECARKVADELRLDTHRVIAAPSLRSIDTVSAISNHDAEVTCENTCVPGRNLFLLTLAAGLAYTHGVHVVAIGLFGSSVYPDTTPQFVEHAERAIATAFGVNIRVLAPLMSEDEEELRAFARELHGTRLFGLTHSCYEDAKPCGTCLGCVKRRIEFSSLGLIDPLETSVE